LPPDRLQGFPQTPLARRADAAQGGQGWVMMYLAGAARADKRY